MTREEFNKKYPFAANMKYNDIRQLMVFMITGMLEDAFNKGTDPENDKLKVFLTDMIDLKDEDKTNG